MDFFYIWNFTDGIGTKPLIGKLCYFARNLPPCVGGRGLFDGGSGLFGGGGGSADG